MYKKRSQYFFKQTDFMIVDLLCLFLAYTASSVFISNALEMEVSPSFRRDALIVLLLDVMVAYMWDAFLDVLIRDAFAELEACIKHALRLFMAMVLFFFLNGESDFYVRGILIECILIYVTLTFGGRLLWKAYQKNIRNKTGTLSIHLVTTKKLAEECIRNVQLDPTERYRVAGITIVDQDCRGTQISGIPVVSTQEDLIDYICQNWIDEVFLCMPNRTTLPEDIMRTMRQMGLVLHMNVSEDSDLLGKKQSTGKIGGYVVLTTALRYATSGQMLLKRLLDIVGGIVGCIITGILFLILAPMIKINSPGPVFFKQERVGRNGKHFHIYKFRSMVMNADKIKAELMDQNRVENGYMFKMENDRMPAQGDRVMTGREKLLWLWDFLKLWLLEK
ncbi:MAG: sugar transferase, partial [Blautia sp.]|nr:sugar transferase [Blautia sp.]